jgi:SAM-dependent methyltransferase
VTTFERYACYYDLLYNDKDYESEATFVAELISHHAPNGRSILELGCGTGVHALALARRGYSVAGVDMSHEMTAQARLKLSNAILPVGIHVSFQEGDIRTIRLNETYDAVISLFHVMSYQVTDADVLTALATVERHMKPGGIVIFDYWYSPAVRKDPPTIRVKSAEDDAVHVRRVARPSMQLGGNLVDVHYDITIESKISRSTHQISEHHRMRHFSEDELKRSLRTVGLRPIQSGKWPTAKPGSTSTWSAYLVAARAA